MSAAKGNTAGVGVVPPDSLQVKFWNDESTELSDQRVRQQVPSLASIDQAFATSKGGVEALAFFAHQVVKTTDKAVVMRAIASALSCLFNDNTNYTGSRSTISALTGLEKVLSEDADPNEILATNFEDAEDVSIQEIRNLMDADSDELGAYFGVLMLAGNKQLTPQNRTAFNERRQSSATASILGDPVIFIPDSIYLADNVIKKVYASFISCQPLRGHMTSRTVTHLGKVHMGPAAAFITMFLLLVDSGMSALRIIKEAVIKHPWIRSKFPELKVELEAANVAQNIIKRAPASDRPFLKAIHGNNFVPVNYSQINNLLGVCRSVLARTTPSYQNYAGGSVTEGQLATINRELAKEGTEIATTKPVAPDVE